LRRRLATAALFACVALCAPAAETLAQVGLPSDFVNEVLVTGMDQPTSLAFLPDGRVLITEQHTGKIRMVVNGHLASTDPIFVVAALTEGYERGLEGIAVDPRWPVRPYVYLYYTRSGGFCRLVRYRATGDVADPLGESLGLSSPLLLIDDIPDLSPNHNSGCLRFAPDGALFLSVGDDEQWCEGADSTKLRGALLRLDVMRLGDASGGPVARDSITPGDNPLVTSNPNARIEWAYGMRNPWRYQIDPVTNLIYVSDVGENIVEELNEVRPGDYLGWPWREGNVTVPRANCPEPGGLGTHPYVHPIVAMGRGPEMTAIISAGAAVLQR
jgi:glucose/arabinose dehydrogenase